MVKKKLGRLSFPCGRPLLKLLRGADKETRGRNPQQLALIRVHLIHLNFSYISRARRERERVIWSIFAIAGLLRVANHYSAFGACLRAHGDEGD